MNNNDYRMTDESIASELGRRVERLRLDSSKELTQLDLAKEAGISRSTYQNLIEGKGTLINYIKVLRVLDGLDSLDAFLPQQPLSPIQLLKMQGRVRQRVKKKSL